jgi:hypothetical protein
MIKYFNRPTLTRRDYDLSIHYINGSLHIYLFDYFSCYDYEINFNICLSRMINHRFKYHEKTKI